MNNKDRHLPLYEYLNRLQIEYFSYQLRSKIYPIEFHKSFWKSTMEKKKKNIEELSTRNRIGNIFNDGDIERQFKEKFFEFGVPNFQYRDEEFRNRWEKWDKFNYYARGSEVRVETEKETMFGKVVDYEVGNSYLYVMIEGSSLKFSVTQVHRIL